MGAAQAGAFDVELVPVTTPDGTEVTSDEGPRPDSTLASLARRRPVFAADGTVTAGNSSSLNDGAAAVLLATEAGLERHGLTPLVRVVDWATAGVEPRRMGIGPAPATRKALERAGWKLGDLALVELNEAFAAIIAERAPGGRSNSPSLLYAPAPPRPPHCLTSPPRPCSKALTRPSGFRPSRPETSVSRLRLPAPFMCRGGAG